MDQKSLRELERKCLQEEAPACQSACPLHVDARTFVSQVGRGRWSDAWKTLNKTMPFPGILARICDHPCEADCLRHDLGGSIRISDLEKACVKQPKPRIRTLPMPSKNIGMAVIGSELSSLVAALDLLRKGYAVTLFSGAKKLGESLRQMGDEILPADIVESELAILTSLKLQTKNEIPTSETLPDLFTSFTAIYIGLDDPQCNHFIEDRDPSPDPKTFALPEADKKGQFAGGKSKSPVQQAFEGRAAALSMERFAQEVGFSEGRRDEGAHSTRLFTNTDGIESMTPVKPKDPEQGYTEEEAKQEAKRCIDCQCLECLKVCPYLEYYKGFPKKYAREIYNNASVVQGKHSANLMINSCTMCGLCTEICPGNFSMADLCLDARRDMVQRKYMPLSAHEFALLDMQFSNSDHFLLHHHAKGKSKSRFAFFPGCQLSGSDPKKTAVVYDFLCSNWSDETGVMLQCCAAPAHWAGNEAEADQAISLLRDNWQKMGSPTLIVACSSCLEMLGSYLPEIEKISLWEVLDQCDPLGTGTGTGTGTEMTENGEGGQENAKSMVMAIHDPCTTRHAPEVQSAARSVAGKLGIQLQELEFSREKTECCGFGGLMQNANPEMAKKQLERRSAQSDLDYLAYCAMCRDSLRGSGKRTAHLLDFLFPQEEKVDPAARTKTGISESRENRVLLKQQLSRVLKDGEDGEIDRDQVILADEKSIRLHISPEVAAKLEARRILHDDIRQTIAHAEKSGQKMESCESGRFLAAHRPHLVTFWVEYSPADIGYHVHNSYCHRMQIKGGH